MKNFRASPNIRTEADIRNAIEAEILLSLENETTGDGAILWDTDRGSLSIESDDLLQDAGLQTAVTISLFTDARAEEHDILPDDGGSRRGHWADCLPIPGTDDMGRIGSKLWLLRREKQMREVFNRAEEYARSALQWMVDYKIASKVEVRATPAIPGWLYLEIDIHRPDRRVVTYKYEYNWLEHQRHMETVNRAV